MMDRISRREAITMAGASLALASKPTSPEDSEKRRYGPAHGVDDHWGKNPALCPDYDGSVAMQEYDPEFIAIAIIDFSKSWTADVHHASFPLGPSGSQTPEDYRRDLAIRLIAWTIDNNRKLGALHTDPFGKKDHIPYKRKASYPQQYHINSFDAFKFKSQNEVFIFLKNPYIELSPDRLIRFTRYAFDGVNEMAKNYSFFNAKLVKDVYLADLAHFGKLIRVENHVTNADGSPVVEMTDYSMNILFKARSSSGTSFLPMIIDPETGNGAGHEP